jgi:hypothetical protein
MAEVYKQMPVLPDSSPQTQYIRQSGRKSQSLRKEESGRSSFGWKNTDSESPDSLRSAVHGNSKSIWYLNL